MSFLYPYFLFLLPLSLLPLFLLLGNRGKKKKVFFSTLYLLKLREFREERVRQQLRQWLLIIIRILMLITVILLFSRPRYFGSRWHDAYFDASYSMKSRENENNLRKIFSIFGESRIHIINTRNRNLFMLDTSYVPLLSKRDVFYTDCKLPYMPGGRIIPAVYNNHDTWLYMEKTHYDTLFLRVKVPIKTYIDVYKDFNRVDSILVTKEDSIITYVSSFKGLLAFKLRIEDELSENNEFYYVTHTNVLEVNLKQKNRILEAFFDTPPFALDYKSKNCVAIDTVFDGCENTVVFINKRHDLIKKYGTYGKIVNISHYKGLLVHSGISRFILLSIPPIDTQSAFFDPEFLTGLYNFITHFFAEGSVKYNFYFHDFTEKGCKVLSPGRKNHITGFYICRKDTVAVNIDPLEYIAPALKDTDHTLSMKDLNTILVPQRLLVYFLLLLFIMESLLVIIV